jgi:hypothetical protein
MRVRDRSMSLLGGVALSVTLRRVDHSRRYLVSEERGATSLGGGTWERGAPGGGT